ncbi:organic cation transporter, putative [Pediculus humanus corporis]|uniref:Organic cation transporter, putative n=1 Tax=Pediculus humanus subsp. corporis TaxID=121224 RepID=E0VS39_PEDHC|nr:organic cation transporter, putative [Pediculus humanus corporis]EEB16195.1 organic cation transporter, putative [Pediculus humanus corporis]
MPSTKSSSNVKNFTTTTTHDGLDLDDVLPEIGEFGKYQKYLFWFVCLPACIPCGFCAFNQIFMSGVPEHWCKIPSLMNLQPEKRKQLGIPLEDEENHIYSSCFRFNLSWINFTFLDDYENMSDVTSSSGKNVEPCFDGWEYNKSTIESSVVVDFNLVCEKDLYPTIGLSALNAGGPIGVYIFGILNDKIGRKFSFFACLAILLTGGILTGVSSNFWLWAWSRFIVGLTVPAIYQIPFIISLELVGPNYRAFVTVFTCLAYTFGLILLSGVAYLLPDWRLLAFATSVPFLLYFGYWFYLPESPRWLITKGRFDEALLILEKIAQTNGKKLPEAFKTCLKREMLSKTMSEENKKNKKWPKFGDLCLTPNMRLKTILITFSWFANEMVYVGLSYYGPSLDTNAYLSFFLSAVVEIPSYLGCWVVMDRWGRRWPLCLCMVISGICCIATVLIPPDYTTLTLVLYLVSKSAISASFLIIYPFAGELYPTQLRGIGIGTSAYVGGLGLIIIPFINYLGRENLILPLLIMGIVSVIGGLTSLRLPETLRQKLPQTILEGEEFGKNWTLKNCWSCVPESSTPNSYEDLSKDDFQEEIEIKPPLIRKASRLIRESSVMETNLDSSGIMQMTYWF